MKVRVIKGRRKGEILETNEYTCFSCIDNRIGHVTIEEAIEFGILEEVKEPQMLEEKFNEYCRKGNSKSLPTKYYCDSETLESLALIAKSHYANYVDKGEIVKLIDGWRSSAESMNTLLKEILDLKTEGEK